MEETSAFTEADFYQANFNPTSYMNSFYYRPEGHSEDKIALTFILECLSRTFSTGRFKGQRLIEVGSGPTVHSIISACEHFQELVLSDYLDRNREEIKKWIKNEEGCFNWTPIIEYVCKLEGKSLSDVEVKMRQRVKQVLKCDVLLENPFHPENVQPAECVITSLCLEAACKDLQTYREAVRRVAQLLLPGGALVMIGVLEETFYYVDKTRFSCLKLSKAIIEDVLRNLHFTVQEFNIYPTQDKRQNKVSDHEAFFFLVALKSK